MRNKQDITDYKKLWIASCLAMTDNRLTLRLLHSARLPVFARHEAIQKVQLLYVINFSSLSSFVSGESLPERPALRTFGGKFRFP
jgi:hypothetical protein